MLRKLKNHSMHLGATLLTWALLAMLAACILFPLYWMLMTSFKPMSEVWTYPPIFFPRHFMGLANYREVVRRVPVAQFYGNSIYVGAARTLATLFTCSLVGYVFAKFEFAAKETLFMLVLATMMVPATVTLIPYFILFKDLGLLNTLAAVIVPGLTSASGIFMVRQYVESIPNELIAAARIDGCGEFWIYATLILPLCKPVLSALGIFTFLNSWNEFLWPLLVLRDKHLLTLPVGLNMFAGTMMRQQQWIHLAMAFVTMAVLPGMLVFLAGQRHFVQGIALTGMKG
ncbi:MAG: carbohydrate ABC transporter permease [Anaerolineae bacterium]|nr:carbohydrate ABC transporter permease [Anaerolineae bacterium]